MKKLLGIISLIACIALLLCGCGSWVKVDSITFTSVQCDSEITLKVTGKTDPNGENFDGCTYSDNRSKEELIEELKQNDIEIFTEQGFDFIRPFGNNGVYYLDIRKSTEIETTIVCIDDMSREFSAYSNAGLKRETILKHFPFPHFMLEVITDRQVALMSMEGILMNEPYKCDGAKLLDLVKTLGIWEVEEKEDSFIMAFKEDKIEVVYGDGTVTLQQVSQ